MFLTIHYGDRAGYDRTVDSVKTAAHNHDSWLAQRGAVMGTAGAPIQVRNHNAEGIETMQGAFLRSDLPIAGFELIEARDTNEAVDLVGGTPCAVAHGVVEVWPLL
jgi:hypothetical protein